MQIVPISERSWSRIAEIQREVYVDLEPESLAVLQRKWEVSPEHCLVCKTAGEVAGYLLAHVWNRPQPPKLYELLPEVEGGAELFLHDLAVAETAKGQGVGARLAQQLIDDARAGRYRRISLVSVQESEGFWRHMGFSPVASRVAPCYGDDARLMAMELN